MTRKLFRWTITVILSSYFLLCTFYYLFQQNFLFTNTRPANYVYQFDNKFEERNILTKDGKKLNGLLFKSDSSKGLIFYLHGGGHSLDKWGKYAKTISTSIMIYSSWTIVALGKVREIFLPKSNCIVTHKMHITI
jgi:hypothetical protein